MRATRSLILLLALAACDTLGSDVEKVAINDTDRIDLSTLSQDPAALVGDWEWTQSVYYFTPAGTPNLETPESSGRTQRWAFLAGGRARYYENGELVHESTYEVSRRTYGTDTSEERPSLRIDGGYGYDFGVAGDLLVLDSTPVDGPQSRFKRK